MTIIMKNGKHFDYDDGASVAFAADRVIVVKGEDGEVLAWLNIDEFSSIHTQFQPDLEFMIRRLRASEKKSDPVESAKRMKLLIEWLDAEVGVP